MHKSVVFLALVASIVIALVIPRNNLIYRRSGLHQSESASGLGDRNSADAFPPDKAKAAPFKSGKGEALDCGNYTESCRSLVFCNPVTHHLWRTSLMTMSPPPSMTHHVVKAYNTLFGRKPQTRAVCEKECQCVGEPTVTIPD